MNIGFRVDSSSIIGSGHLMRCLVLANKIRKKIKCNILFIMNDLDNNLSSLVEKENFEIFKFQLKESNWTQLKEANLIIDKFELKYFDIIFVDNYTLDFNWEILIKKITKKIFVIDDLANRKHICDYLLDQNLSESSEDKYKSFIPNETIKFLGPKFALLRDEFINLGNNVKIKNNGLKNLLISFGGTDPTYETLKVIHAISNLHSKFNSIDIVVGMGNLAISQIIDETKNIKNITIHVQISNMSELMIKADLCIGSGGTTSWERCFLALPAFIIMVADNQLELTQTLEKKGAILNLGKYNEVSPNIIQSKLNEIFENSNILEEMSINCQRVLNIDVFLGSEYICNQIFNLGNI